MARNIFVTWLICNPLTILLLTIFFIGTNHPESLKHTLETAIILYTNFWLSVYGAGLYFIAKTITKSETCFVECPYCNSIYNIQKDKFSVVFTDCPKCHRIVKVNNKTEYYYHEYEKSNEQIPLQRNNINVDRNSIT